MLRAAVTSRHCIILPSHIVELSSAVINVSNETLNRAVTSFPTVYPSTCLGPKALYGYAFRRRHNNNVKAYSIKIRLLPQIISLINVG